MHLGIYNFKTMVIFECTKHEDIYKAVEYTVTSDERGEACIQAIEVGINVLENVENLGSAMINVNLPTTDRLSSSLRRRKIVTERFRKFTGN